MKRFTVIFLTVALCACSLFGFSACNSANKTSTDAEFRPSNSPDSDVVLSYTLPADDDLAGHKTLADTLYTLANQNDQKIESRAYATNFTTQILSGAVETTGYRYEVKNGEEYCFTDYSFGGETGLSMLASAFDAVYVERRYTNSWMDDMYCERVSTSNKYLYVVSANNADYYGQDDKEFSAVWDNTEGNPLTVSHLEKPYYNATQELKYQFNGNYISASTMEYAKVTHNDEEGFYKVEFRLDMNNPASTAKTILELRASSGNDSAYYTLVSGYMEIWDNGYFKRFQSYDGFIIPMGAFPVDSALDYETYFYYDAKSCDIENYQYMFDVASKCYAAATGGDYTSEIYSAANPKVVTKNVFVTMIVVVVCLGATLLVKKLVK